ncbi:hypothetical protein [Rathayibacter sp. SD072]|uniref:hypothetical protein n=1 Tax=Rathayibacter sp. SD072 TaxID=2781731 RepID=UPI001A968635|nr:hypothetical protein [Rathayibacter sp. SD072]MBO0983481.1 hypothetical protein [Rathayibacter sp. SD072]
MHEPEQLPVPPERVLRDLLDAFAQPGAVDPGLARHVLGHVQEALDRLEMRRRMPTLMVPRSAVDEIPDPPPVPPAAL